MTDENGAQQSLQYQVGSDTPLDFSEFGIELDIADSYSDGLNGTQIEISPNRDLQVGADNDANHQLQLVISSVTANGLRIDGSQVVDIDQARAAITSLDHATDMVNQELTLPRFDAESFSFHHVKPKQPNAEYRIVTIKYRGCGLCG